MTTVFKGNKREVPPDMPMLVWRDLVLEAEGGSGIDDIPWHHELLEYLSPEELRRVKAKALVWYMATEEWPKEIAWYWEVRMARRRGAIPASQEFTPVVIDKEGVLRCGKCGARWSSDANGTHQDRCKLCDTKWLVLRDEREGTDGPENHPAESG